MSASSLYGTSSIVALLLVACVAGCAHPSQSAGNTGGGTDVVSGTVVYRERIALPPDAVQRVITQGNPTHVDLRIVRASGAPSTGTSRFVGTEWLLEDLGEPE